LWQYGKNRHITPNILECPGAILTYFADLIGVFMGMITPDIRLVVAQGALLWQPVEFGRCSQTSLGTTLFFASAFDN